MYQITFCLKWVKRRRPRVCQIRPRVCQIRPRVCQIRHRVCQIRPRVCQIRPRVSLPPSRLDGCFLCGLQRKPYLLLHLAMHTLLAIGDGCINTCSLALTSARRTGSRLGFGSRYGFGAASSAPASASVMCVGIIECTNTEGLSSR